MKLYLVRHGKTDWNNKHLIQGHTDIELNADGKNMAQELAKTINIDDIDICFCSPLKRARETAEILVNNKIDIIEDNLLIERFFGDYEGTLLNYDDLYKHWNLIDDYNGNNLEPLSSCLDRAEKFINKLKSNYNDKNVLIVSHASLLKALHFVIKGYDVNTDFLSFVPKNTILYEYEIK